jgi:hypothetical protein
MATSSAPSSPSSTIRGTTVRSTQSTDPTPRRMTIAEARGSAPGFLPFWAVSPEHLRRRELRPHLGGAHIDYTERAEGARRVRGLGKPARLPTLHAALERFLCVPYDQSATARPNVRFHPIAAFATAGARSCGNKHSCCS